jgi:hypothetical protein
MFSTLARIHLLALGVAVLAACGRGSPQEQLLGVWTLDRELLQETQEFKDAPETERQMMMGLLQGMNMEITFTKDKVNMSMKASFMGQSKESSEQGTYRVVSTDGDKLVLDMTDDQGKTERFQVEVDGDKLIVRADDSPPMTLRRK